jgi:hypothetical protein
MLQEAYASINGVRCGSTSGMRKADAGQSKSELNRNTQPRPPLGKRSSGCRSETKKNELGRQWEM